VPRSAAIDGCLTYLAASAAARTTPLNKTVLSGRGQPFHASQMADPVNTPVAAGTYKLERTLLLGRA